MTDKFTVTIITNSNILFVAEYSSVPQLPNIGDVLQLSKPIQPHDSIHTTDEYKVVKRTFGYSTDIPSAVNYSGCTITVEPFSASEPTRHTILHDDIEAFNRWFKRNGYKDTHYYPCLSAWEGCFAYAQHGGNPAEFCRYKLAQGSCMLYKGHDNGIHA